MNYDISVPENISAVLFDLFPDLSPDDVDWSWEIYNKIYEAEFNIDGEEYEVEITVTGHHLLTEQEISVADIPEKVMDVLQKKYPGFSIVEAEKITWSTGEVFYELDMEDEDGEDELEIHISEDGILTAEGEDL